METESALTLYSYSILFSVLESSRTSPRPRESSRTILKSLVLALKVESLALALALRVESLASALALRPVSLTPSLLILQFKRQSE